MAIYGLSAINGRSNLEPMALLDRPSIDGEVGPTDGGERYFGL